MYTTADGHIVREQFLADFEQFFSAFTHEGIWFPRGQGCYKQLYFKHSSQQPDKTCAKKHTIFSGNL